MSHKSILKALSANKLKQEQLLHRTQEGLQQRAIRLGDAKHLANQRREAQISSQRVSGLLLKNTLIFTSQAVETAGDDYTRYRQQHEEKKASWRRVREQVEHMKGQHAQQRRQKTAKIDRKETDDVAMSAVSVA